MSVNVGFTIGNVSNAIRPWCVDGNVVHAVAPYGLKRWHGIKKLRRDSEQCGDIGRAQKDSKNAANVIVAIETT